MGWFTRGKSGQKETRGFFARLVLDVRDRLFGATTGPRWTAPAEALEYFRDPGAWKAVVSSNVKAIGYFASVKRGVKSALGVQFLSNTTYYYDVPNVSLYGEFSVASSKGRFLHTRIKLTGVPYDGPH